MSGAQGRAGAEPLFRYIPASRKEHIRGRSQPKKSVVALRCSGSRSLDRISAVLASSAYTVRHCYCLPATTNTVIVVPQLLSTSSASCVSWCPFYVSSASYSSSLRSSPAPLDSSRRSGFTCRRMTDAAPRRPPRWRRTEAAWLKPPWRRQPRWARCPQHLRHRFLDWAKSSLVAC